MRTKFGNMTMLKDIQGAQTSAKAAFANKLGKFPGVDLDPDMDADLCQSLIISSTAHGQPSHKISLRSSTKDVCMRGDGMAHHTYRLPSCRRPLWSTHICFFLPSNTEV